MNHIETPFLKRGWWVSCKDSNLESEMGPLSQGAAVGCDHCKALDGATAVSRCGVAHELVTKLESKLRTLAEHF